MPAMFLAIGERCSLQGFVHVRLSASGVGLVRQRRRLHESTCGDSQRRMQLHARATFAVDWTIVLKPGKWIGSRYLVFAFDGRGCS